MDVAYYDVTMVTNDQSQNDDRKMTSLIRHIMTLSWLPYYDSSLKLS